MSLFKKKEKDKGRGIILFMDTADALSAERVLLFEGKDAKLVAPPLEMRKGCDLAVSVSLFEKPGIERILREKDIFFVAIISSDAMERSPSEILVRTNFKSGMIMVKAANMKLTFNPENGVILNVSGGGCPDIPYLYRSLEGKKLSDAESPGRMGFTLCALMLERAFEECKRIYLKTEG